MNVSVSLMFTDDNGRFVGLWQGKRVKISTEHQLQAIEESFQSATVNKSFEDLNAQPIHQHD